jgi:hypothetical protein
MAGIEPSDELRKDLVKLVRSEIGAIATPDVIQWAPGLPKTRSGKSCVAFCVKLPPTKFLIWEILQHWLIQCG